MWLQSGCRLGNFDLTNKLTSQLTKLNAWPLKQSIPKEANEIKSQYLRDYFVTIENLDCNNTFIGWIKWTIL